LIGCVPHIFEVGIAWRVGEGKKDLELVLKSLPPPRAEFGFYPLCDTADPETTKKNIRERILLGKYKIEIIRGL